MLVDKKTKVNTGMGVGVGLQLFGILIGDWGCALVLLGIVAWTWGCLHYAEGKGHNKWVGLVGLTGLLGLIVLWLLPDQHPEATPTQVDSH